jgi:RNA polymerase sigma-70 factor (ECF subfamily)
MIPEEDKVIEAVRLGNTQAYHLLVDGYKDMVYTLCIRMVKNSMHAEELAQDAFLKAFQHIGSYRKESKFSTWLYRIAFNTCLSALRKNKVDEVDIDENHFTSEANLGPRNLEERDNGHLLKMAMDQLKKEEQVIVQLFFLEELSIKEIAEITSISESNVKVKLHRSKQKLKEIIQMRFPELDRNSVYLN